MTNKSVEMFASLFQNLENHFEEKTKNPNLRLSWPLACAELVNTVATEPQDAEYATE